jgi:hypothetical protein
MSWAIDVTGTKSAVAKKVTEQLDKIAASYEGTEEAKDVHVAKERILAIVADMDLEPGSTVAKKVTKMAEQLDKIAKSAASQKEKDKEKAKEVMLAAKERILAIVDAVDLEADADGPAWNAIQVKANGTHNLSAKGIVDARMAISVIRTRLALDD